MGLDMWLYAECKYNGKWISLNPLVENWNTGEIETEYLYSGGYGLFDALKEIGEAQMAKEERESLSPRLKNSLFEEMTEEEIENNADCYLIYDFSEIEKKLKGSSPSEPLYQGYADKKEIIQFEKGLLSDIYDFLTPEEYFSLTPKQKRRYRFYAWDEANSPYYYYRTIVRNVYDQFRLFKSIVYRERLDWETMRERLDEANKSIRLIGCISY